MPWNLLRKGFYIKIVSEVTNKKYTVYIQDCHPLGWWNRIVICFGHGKGNWNGNWNNVAYKTVLRKEWAGDQAYTTDHVKWKDLNENVWEKRNVPDNSWYAFYMVEGVPIWGADFFPELSGFKELTVISYEEACQIRSRLEEILLNEEISNESRVKIINQGIRIATKVIRTYVANSERPKKEFSNNRHSYKLTCPVLVAKIREWHSELLVLQERLLSQEAYCKFCERYLPS